MVSSRISSLRDPFILTAAVIFAMGVCLRIWAACATVLWIDEAESSINALTILETGLPVDHYLGEPIYENTLTEPMPDSDEYEFRDSSYSKKGLAVYHGWLPLYSIAAAQALFGIHPDSLDSESLAPRHEPDEIFIRTLVPRLPAIVFSSLNLVVVFILVRQMAGKPAALTSLVWLALGAKAIGFGHMARYYSLTLLMSSLCALAAWRVYRRGHTFDFIIFGVAEGLLFHTHQLSAVVFACASLLLLPSIFRRRHGVRNLLIAIGIAGAMTIPWAILSGFFDTASEVPKAYELFSSFGDWTGYFLDRPVVLVIFALLAAFPLISWLGIRKGWKKPTAHTPNVMAALVFLVGWIFFAVICFHLLVPAASFMLERLTLILFTPAALLLGIALAEFYPRIKGVPYAASLLLPLGFLYLSHHLPGRLPKFEYQEQTIAALIEYLEAQDLKPPCRIYASPTDHHIWKYYTGLPIQSIVPVRRSYLETFPHDLVYLENPWVFVSPSLKSIQDEAREAGLTLDDLEARVFRNDLVTNQIIRSLKVRGLYEQGQEIELPDYLWEIQENMQVANAEAVAGAIRMWKRQVIFKDVDVPVFQDLWLAFYYRFSGYPERMGENWNIYPILKESEVTVLPKAMTVVYHHTGSGD